MSKEMAKKTATKKAAPRKRAAKPKKTEAPVNAPQLTDAQIRARAYEIYRRGANPSDPTADWLQAVQELRAEAGT